MGVVADAQYLRDGNKLQSKSAMLCSAAKQSCVPWQSVSIITLRLCPCPSATWLDNEDVHLPKNQIFNGRIISMLEQDLASCLHSSCVGGHMMTRVLCGSSRSTESNSLAELQTAPSEPAACSAVCWLPVQASLLVLSAGPATGWVAASAPKPPAGAALTCWLPAEADDSAGQASRLLLALAPAGCGGLAGLVAGDVGPRRGFALLRRKVRVAPRDSEAMIALGPRVCSRSAAQVLMVRLL